MKTPFFVTGLPRSRTAWAANWLTTDRSMCYHDPFPGSVSSLLAGYGLTLPVSGDERIVGASGPELMLEHEDLARYYPSAPWVVLLRNPDDAKASFEALMNRECVRLQDWALEETWDARRIALKRLCLQPMVLAVNVEELDDQAQASRVWNWLLPNLQFDGGRWKQLRNLNIQQHFTKRLTQLAKEGV